jgi:ABC-2 type transport system ATP-binding protein
VFIISKGKLVASDSTENLVSLMSGAQEINLTVRRDGEQARELLQSVEEIERVELLSESEEQTQLRIHAVKGADAREQVFAQMAQNQIPVLEMHTVIKSLEDVFLEITQEGEQK